MASFKQVDLNKIVDKYLNVLKKDRDKEVLKKRNGLLGFDVHTLDQIGKKYGITRERVRQIEKAAQKKIDKISNHSNSLNENILELLVEFGGLISLETLLAKLKLTTTDANNVLFLVKANPALLLINKSESFECMIVNKHMYCAEDIFEIHEKMVKLFSKINKPLKFDRVYQEAVKEGKIEMAQEIANASSLLVELDKLWGLNSWSEVNPKSIRDKIYFVLKKNARPLHFSEIARLINSINEKKSVTRQAVHNVLIKDSRFVLIGRGIYALSEWGYQAGTVADIIVDILRSESPLSKQEIIKRVLARRQVKIATIVLNLQNKEKFRRVEKGVYTLTTAHQ